MVSQNRKGKNCKRTIVNIVQVGVWVIRVINDQWATEPVAILQFVMGVVPIGSRLILGVKPILEVLARLNRTLGYERDAVSPVGSVLEYSVPMLKTPSEKADTGKTSNELTMVVVSSMFGSFKLLMTLIEKLRPYYRTRRLSTTAQRKKIKSRTFCALITGPGKVPPASVALGT